MKTDEKIKKNNMHCDVHYYSKKMKLNSTFVWRTKKVNCIIG